MAKGELALTSYRIACTCQDLAGRLNSRPAIRVGLVPL